MLQKLLIPPGVLLIELLCVEEERLCRHHQAGCLQLLNYNLGTQVDHAAHHLPDFPFPLSPGPFPSHSQSVLASSVKDPWPLLFRKHCPYSCCLASFLLMEIYDWWCQGRSPYGSYRQTRSHIGNMPCWEEARGDTAGEEEEEEDMCFFRCAGSWQLWSERREYHANSVQVCHLQMQLSSKGK